MPGDEGVAKIDLLRLGMIQRVSGRFAPPFEQDRLVAFLQPASHAAFQVRHAHGVAVAFVGDELVIHLRQNRTIAPDRHPPRQNW